MNQPGAFKGNIRSGWILCSSKTFPGKYYYYNIHSREASWCIDDSDKQRYGLQSYNAPEPRSFYPCNEPASPSDYVPFLSYNGQSFRTHNTPPQIGAISFPNHPPNFSTIPQNVNFWNQRVVEPIVPNVPKTVPPQLSTESAVAVHTTPVPMSQRFLNMRFPFKIKLGQHSQETDHTVPLKRMKTVNPIHSVSQPIQSNRPEFQLRNGNQFNTNESQLIQSRPSRADQHFINPNQSNQTEIWFDEMQSNQERAKSGCEKNHCNCVVMHKCDLKKQSQQEIQSTYEEDQSNHMIEPEIEIQKETCRKPSIFSPVQENDEVPSQLCETEIDKNTESLDENDLRLKLRAKQTRSGQTSKDEEIKAPAKETVKPDASNVKKKVRFDMSNTRNFYEEINREFEDQYDSDATQNAPIRAHFGDEDSPSTNQSTALYFVVPDVDFLVNNWELLDDLLKMDVETKIIIPQVVRRELEKSCRGDCADRESVIRGRQVTRLIATHGHSIVNEEMNADFKYTENPVIDCCINALEKGLQVYLLANNKKLENEATEHYITYFSVREIEDYVSSDPQVTFQTEIPEKENNDLVQSPILESKCMKKSKITNPPKNNFVCTENSAVPKNSEKAVHVPKNSEVQKDVINVQETSESTNIAINNEPIVKIPKLKTNLVMGNNDLSKKNKKTDTLGNYKIPKLDVCSSVMEELKRFSIKNDVMKKNLISRKEEFIVRFTQIVEDGLTDVLLNKINERDAQPPWLLHEAVDCVKNIYENNARINFLTNKLSYLLKAFNPKGTIKLDIKLDDFMTIFGLSYLLVEALMTFPYNKRKLQGPKAKLMDLLKNMEEPSTQENVKVKNAVNTKNNENQIKNSDKGFSPELYNMFNIVSTIGKDVDKLIINNKKEISIQNTDNKPKVIRKLNVIEEFEKKIDKGLNMDVLDYENDSSSTNTLIVDDMVMVEYQDEITEEPQQLHGDAVTDKHTNQNTNAEEKASYAHSVVDNYLSSLRGIFESIYNFIKKTSELFKSKEVSPIRKERSNKKTDMASEHIKEEIICRLKRIIQRESTASDQSLINILSKADFDRNDVKLWRYRQIITKCLEQAELLLIALNILKRLINGWEDGNDEIQAVLQKIQYYNIFE